MPQFLLILKGKEQSIGFAMGCSATLTAEYQTKDLQIADQRSLSYGTSTDRLCFQMNIPTTIAGLQQRKNKFIPRFLLIYILEVQHHTISSIFFYRRKLEQFIIACHPPPPVLQRTIHSPNIFILSRKQPHY
jgi:hypothetical protein